MCNNINVLYQFFFFSLPSNKRLMIDFYIYLKGMSLFLSVCLSACLPVCLSVSLTLSTQLVKADGCPPRARFWNRKNKRITSSPLGNQVCSQVLVVRGQFVFYFLLCTHNHSDSCSNICTGGETMLYMDGRFIPLQLQ